MSIKNNLQNLKNSLPKNIILIGITKYSNKKDILQAIDSGLKHIGESRIESIEKIKDISAVKHFIGPIQSNKIKKIVENFNLIQSVSSLKHLIKINKEAKNLNKIQNILLQLKISNDKNKSGIKQEELKEILKVIPNLKNINFQGFMMIASNTKDQNQIEQEFEKTNDIYNKYKHTHNLKYLSMGMSNDYKLAIKHGSNMIRIGSLIFK